MTDYKLQKQVTLTMGEWHLTLRTIEQCALQEIRSNDKFMFGNFVNLLDSIREQLGLADFRDHDSIDDETITEQTEQVSEGEQRRQGVVKPFPSPSK